jgi:hypothetical protein
LYEAGTESSLYTACRQYTAPLLIIAKSSISRTFLIVQLSVEDYYLFCSVCLVASPRGDNKKDEREIMRDLRVLERRTEEVLNSAVGTNHLQNVGGVGSSGNEG